ncbi:MAG: YegS/Rv2252/BmrU family lipid kinase [Dehalococcoidia bacterium]
MRRARVIINPAAGAGRTAGIWPDAVAALREANLDPDFVLTQAPGQATALAQEAARAGVDVVVAVGGDGTAHEVANGLLREPRCPPLGLIQTGSGRDLARLLCLPRGVAAQARLLAQADPLSLDVGWCDYEGAAGRERAAFLLLGGAGLSARVVRRSIRRKRMARSLTYYLAALREWWTARAVTAVTVLDGAREELRLLDLQVLNAPWVGGGMHMAPGADPQDGALELLITLEQGHWRLLNLLLRLYSGTHIRRPGVRYGRTKRVRVDPETREPVALDGESVGWTPAEFWVDPGALPVLAKEIRAG